MASVAFKYQERRAFGRRECSVEAVAVFSGRTHYDCIVRNFSESGALLEFPEGVEIPEVFTLRIIAKKIEGRCEVRHRSGNRAGIQFVSGTIGVRLEREYQQRLAQAEIARPTAPTPERQRQQLLRLVSPSTSELRRTVLSQISQPPSSAAISTGKSADSQLAAPDGKLLTNDPYGAAQSDAPTAQADGDHMKLRPACRPEPLILPI